MKALLNATTNSVSTTTKVADIVFLNKVYLVVPIVNNEAEFQTNIISEKVGHDFYNHTLTPTNTHNIRYNDTRNVTDWTFLALVVHNADANLRIKLNQYQYAL